MVRLRCIRCRKVLRDNGTCQNENCVLYVPEPEHEEAHIIEKHVEADKEN